MLVKLSRVRRLYALYFLISNGVLVFEVFVFEVLVFETSIFFSHISKACRQKVKQVVWNRKTKGWGWWEDFSAGDGWRVAGDRWWVTGDGWLVAGDGWIIKVKKRRKQLYNFKVYVNKSIVLFCLIYLRGLFLVSEIWKKDRNHTCENSHLSQLTFRQATRGVSNENGRCQARHMARVEANFLIQVSFLQVSGRGVRKTSDFLARL